MAEGIRAESGERSEPREPDGPSERGSTTGTRVGLRAGAQRP